MTVRAVLRERRGAVLERWIELIRAEDASAGASLPARGSDPFHDPVGEALRRGTASILESLVGEGGPAVAREGIDRIVRVRSVQAPTAPRALSFVFLLRRALRDAAGGAVDAAEWGPLDARLDAIALEAFEIYVDCRERVFEIRAREAARANAVLLRRARLGENAPSRPGGATDPADEALR
ncbi:MAG TPA: RsbRD N-terminal domain-containing protein [Thermoanaerobaculia bacterium]|nr:RsbRD N-terminal domain-containing protein [Thermoanaerobaculia bacterium]